MKVLTSEVVRKREVKRKNNLIQKYCYSYLCKLKLKNVELKQSANLKIEIHS